jgi:hypothetical protein
VRKEVPSKETTSRSVVEAKEFLYDGDEPVKFSTLKASLCRYGEILDVLTGKKKLENISQYAKNQYNAYDTAYRSMHGSKGNVCMPASEREEILVCDILAEARRVIDYAEKVKVVGEERKEKTEVGGITTDLLLEILFSKELKSDRSAEIMELLNKLDFGDFSPNEDVRSTTSKQVPANVKERRESTALGSPSALPTTSKITSEKRSTPKITSERRSTSTPKTTSKITPKITPKKRSISTPKTTSKKRSTSTSKTTPSSTSTSKTTPEKRFGSKN